MDDLTKQAIARAKLRQDPKAMAALEKMGISFENAAREMATLIGDDAKAAARASRPPPSAEAATPASRVVLTAMDAPSLPAAIMAILATGPMKKAVLLAKLKASYPPYAEMPNPYKAVSNALVRLRRDDRITYVGDRKPRTIQATPGPEDAA